MSLEEGNEQGKKDRKLETEENAVVFCLCCCCVMRNYFIDGDGLLYTGLDL